MKSSENLSRKHPLTQISVQARVSQSPRPRKHFRALIGFFFSGLKTPESVPNSVPIMRAGKAYFRTRLYEHSLMA